MKHEEGNVFFKYRIDQHGTIALSGFWLRSRQTGRTRRDSRGHGLLTPLSLIAPQTSLVDIGFGCSTQSLN